MCFTSRALRVSPHTVAYVAGGGTHTGATAEHAGVVRVAPPRLDHVGARLGSVSLLHAVGASVLVVMLSAFLWVAAKPLIFPTDRPAPTGQSLIVFDLPQSSGSAWVWVSSDEPIRADSARFSLRFWISSTDPTGSRVLIGGPMTSGMACYGDSIDIDRASFNDLSEDLQRSAEVYAERMPTHGSFTVSWWERNPNAARAESAASGLEYSVVSIGSYTPEDRSFDFGDDSPRLEESRIGSFVCSFSTTQIESIDQGLKVLAMPGVLVRAHMTEAPNGVYVSRTYEFDRDRETEYLSSTPLDFSSSDVVKSSDSSWRAAMKGEGDEYFTAMHPTSIALEATNADGVRQRVFFWSGIASAAIVALAISLLKLGADLGIGIAGRHVPDDSAWRAREVTARSLVLISGAALLAIASWHWLVAPGVELLAATSFDRPADRGSWRSPSRPLPTLPMLQSAPIWSTRARPTNTAWISPSDTATNRPSTPRKRTWR